MSKKLNTFPKYEVYFDGMYQGRCAAADYYGAAKEFGAGAVGLNDHPTVNQLGQDVRGFYDKTHNRMVKTVKVGNGKYKNNNRSKVLFEPVAA